MDRLGTPKTTVILLFILVEIELLISINNGCVIMDNKDLDDFTDRIKRDLNSNCGQDDEIPRNRVNTTERLLELRKVMKMNDLDAYIIPLDQENRRAWISGFDGSNGDAIVTLNKAAVFTDGRYFLQASLQLDCNWELVKKYDTESKSKWMEDNLEFDDKIGADPSLISSQDWLDYASELEKNNLFLEVKHENLVDKVWFDKPPLIPKNIVIHPIEFSGLNWETKVMNLRNELSNSKYDAMLISELDEIAWLFNLRGEGHSMVESLMITPVFESMAYITKDEIRLWVHLDKVTNELSKHLNPSDCQQNSTCVIIGDLEDAIEDIGDITSIIEDQDYKILIPNGGNYVQGANFAQYSRFPKLNIKLDQSPLIKLKAIKNPTEIEGMMNCHIRDAWALIDFASELQEQISNGAENWTEISAAKRLEEYRSKIKRNKGISFNTISAFGSNAAIIHYSAKPETDKVIDGNGLYMVDSGGQYLDGTTDVTRTFYFGQETPSPYQVEMYTRVLMGAIDLAKMKIPSETVDKAVDYATRHYLFDKLRNYRHGTGHGIGSYLRVHEDPILINMKGKASSFEPGMFFSDEPGYYEKNEFGIRLETILRVVELTNDFIGFEAVTLVPFQESLIDISLMIPDQIQWLKNYNKLIRKLVMPHFNETGNDRALNYIIKNTQIID